MNIIESLRQMVIEDLFNLNTVASNWDVWSDCIKNHIGEQPTAQSILDIGDYISEVFKQTGSEGRGQGELSAGGTAWESLVTWYVNLCSIGSRVVAIKKKSTLPTPINDSITVSYANFSCSTESDITVVVFPDDPLFTEYNPSLYKRSGKINFDELNKLVGDKFEDFEVGIIQCKTNWNDNSQIPMLWDMIYSAGGFGKRQITVGRNNYSIQSLNVFTYSFVTVPTNKLSTYKPDCTCVGRVKNLSGGNYWGLPTANGIAKSLKEIFQNYRSGYTNGNIRHTLTKSIPLLGTNYDYFRLSI